MNLYIVNLKDCRYDYDDLFSQLDLDTRKRIDEFKNEDDRIRSVIGHILVNKFTSAEKLCYSDFGKPFKNDEYFNVSHSGDLVVLALADYEVGVDVERLDRDKKNLDEQIFGSNLTQLKFIKNWTRLEAVAKCNGVAFHHGFKNIPHDEGLNEFKDKKYFVKTIEFGQYVISVAVQNDSLDELNLIKLTTL